MIGSPSIMLRSNLPTPVQAPVRRRPMRLQRSRRRGAPHPPHSWYVGRPSFFMTPFSSKKFGHVRAVRLHEQWFEGHLAALSLERLGFCPAEIDALARLRWRALRSLYLLEGLDLVCWCPITSRWCHANTLLRRANPGLFRG